MTVSLDHRTVRVYRANLQVNRPLRPLERATLDAGELHQAERFQQPHDRRRFVRAHARLRQILASYLQVPPREVAWQTSATGKPHLESLAGEPLHFNLSHSGNWALIAVARLPVGIDVERLRDLADLPAMTRRWCTSQESLRMADAATRNDSLQAFFSCWTAKEAALKAIGCGIREEVASIETPPVTRRGFAALAIPASLSTAPWHVAWLDIDQQHLGAVVTPPDVTRIEHVDD
jgi:4'-phosphopantetheinyl transferase